MLSELFDRMSPGESRGAIDDDYTYGRYPAKS
jgi:hypothetical protein